MNQKEATKTSMIILNSKNSLVYMVCTEIIHALRVDIIEVPPMWTVEMFQNVDTST